MNRHRRLASLAALLASAAALGFAIGVERIGGIVPCALCLVERWPYRIAIALAALALLLGSGFGPWLLALVALAMLADAAVAGVHVGVEQHFWPSPLPECAAPHLSGHSIAERLASMPLHVAKPCDAPTYLLPGLPLSMAAMNLIYALAIAVGLAIFLWRERGASS
jgi:disulfide bond formation protein DsbB